MSLSKFKFAKAHVVYLDHVIEEKGGRNTVDLNDAQIQMLKFCLNFASIVAPLTNLVSPKSPFKLISECQATFDALKTLLFLKPINQLPEVFPITGRHFASKPRGLFDARGP